MPAPTRLGQSMSDEGVSGPASKDAFRASRSSLQAGAPFRFAGRGAASDTEVLEAISSRAFRFQRAWHEEVLSEPMATDKTTPTSTRLFNHGGRERERKQPKQITCAMASRSHASARRTSVSQGLRAMGRNKKGAEMLAELLYRSTTLTLCSAPGLARPRHIASTREDERHTTSEMKRGRVA